MIEEKLFDQRRDLFADLSAVFMDTTSLSFYGEGGETPEGQALSFIRSRTAKGTISNADEGSSWDALHAQYEMKRIKHEEAYSLDGACTNWGRNFSAAFAVPNKAIITISPDPYLLRYAQEALREDHRRISNGQQVHMISGLAMKRRPSVEFCGYWQRHW